MEDSPEEILARLERYVATVRARQPIVAVDTLIPTRVPPRAARAVPPVAQPQVTPPRRPPRLLVEVAPALFAVSSCILTIVAFEWLATVAAIVIVVALVLGAAIGLARGMPFARAWTFGLVVAGLLVRFS